MLLKFYVENYKSFKDELCLDMAPAKSQSMKDHILTTKGIKKAKAFPKTKALPVTVIYGANNAGKSNLVKAISFAKKLIVRGNEPDKPIDTFPFWLDSDSGKKGSKFEFVFSNLGVIYTYGFIVNDKRVLEEWLFAYFSNKESKLYERVFKNNTYTIEAGTRLIKNSPGSKTLDLISDIVKPKSLFLTECQDRNIDILEPVYGWFKSKLVVYTPSTKYQPLAIQAHQRQGFIDNISDFLKKSGTGIEEVVCENEPVNLEKVLKEASRNHSRIVPYNRGGEEQFVMIRGPGANMDLHTAKDGKTRSINLKTRHKTSEDDCMDFDLEFESDGTRRLLHIAPILGAIKKSDYVFIMDELGSSLHTLVSRSIIKEFIKNAKSGKSSNSQLIATTHDTNLLDRTLLRKDEISFISKDSDGVSHLESLSSFKINKGLNYENGYLKGRFGAIPFHGNYSSLLE